MTKRRIPRRKRNRNNRPNTNSRHLGHETLERRELLAADLDASPRLIGVNPNSEDIFSDNQLNQLTTSPTELTFRFDGGQEIDPATFSGIRLTAAGGDGSFGESNDEQIIPGFLGFADDSNRQTVVFRFSQPLEDDRYRIEIFGEDNTNSNIVALRNTLGEAFCAADGTSMQAIDFNLELGAQVVAVVPQPVLSDGNGVITQMNDVIDVYFDDVELLGNLSSIENLDFYQLISTNDTVTNNDDEVFPATSATASLVVNPDDLSESVRVRVGFGAPLDTLAGATANTTLRLRVGESEATLARAGSQNTPNQINVANDPGSTLTSANTAALGTFNSDTTIQLEEAIQVSAATQLNLDFPGADNEPGSRDVDADTRGLGGNIDSDILISQRTYSFGLGESYGNDVNGNPVFSTISPEQILRTREVFEFYGSLLGIDFVESVSAANSDLVISVGDLFPLGGVSAPGGEAGLGGGSAVVLDGAEDWNDGFGQNFFTVMMHEIGHAIGYGHNYELAAGSNQGGPGVIADTAAFPQFIFPGEQDIIHGRHLHRPDNLDVDLFRFEIAAGTSGLLTAETFAERKLDEPSLLDTRLTLFEETSEGIVQIAGNDDYFSQDSLIRAELTSGTYYLGVSASADVNYDPEVNLSGSGGISDGAYELFVDFDAVDAAPGITDSLGSELDGDFDGDTGGVYNFWFQANSAASTFYVDKTAGAGGDGSLTTPFRTISDALSAADASTAAHPVVRVVGNAAPGSDLTQSEPYLIGRFATTGTDLEDGSRLEVPANVTLMVDAGAILKFSDAAIHVGSDGGGSARNNGAIQTLGTPNQSVYLTSYSDPTLGDETNPIDQVPGFGDWGGIEIRNDIDRAGGLFELEQEGIFVNYVGNTQITFGGGVVTTSLGSRPVDPIQLAAARPELTHNLIQFSAGQALSADPASFEETTFNEPIHQLLDAFVPDYTRVGPAIHGNTLLDNPINGLFVRVETFAGNDAPELTVTGRFNDTDVVHTLGATLTISGTPGGALLEGLAEAPATALVQTASTSAPGGTISPGDSISYRVTYTDANNFESLPSSATLPIVVGATANAINLSGLPSVNRDYVGRRLYRSVNGGNFELVTSLDGVTSTFTDTGETLSATLDPNLLTATTRNRSRLDGTLVIDPGVIIKGAGVRIDTEIGATLIAEGEPGKPIVFTSRNDDRYGTGGTFDLSSDGGSTGTAGDWGGIYGAPFSRVSIDNSVIAFAGGTAPIAGGFGQFNAVELHQAEGRISNVLFEDNAAGAAGNNGSGARDVFATNSQAVIYVAGAQPFIVDNTFVRNDAAPISINATALSNSQRQDFGRQARPSDVFEVTPGNAGPIVENNLVSDNALNGLIVRGETLNAESVFDDTDIVHIVDGRILVPDITHEGGLRLQSSESESLVVKFTDGSGLEATGHPLDIDDRIGGRIQIIGAPAFPVVLTGIRDDSIGAGFGPGGQATVDTNGDGNASTATPGNWTGILLDEFSHDRNIATLRESEGEIGGFGDSNAVPSSAQQIGILAPNEVSGDENLRLGFEIHGAIANNSDNDVYSFEATGGTHIWIDIDRTDTSLDSVVEVIDSNGNILAISDNSNSESINGSLIPFPGGTAQDALPMQRDPLAPNNALGSYRDLYSVNPNDAGLRLTLPDGATGTFFIRVRSSNFVDPADQADLFDPTKVRDGNSQGSYNLNVRLRELDEFGGSSISHADIRYATNGITTFGLPAHSPFTGEALADPAANTLSGGVSLGNIGNQDRAAASIAGELTTDLTEPLVFTFDLFRDSIQEIVEPGDTAPASDDHYSLTIDVDYSDGIGQPDVNFFLYYSATAGGDQSLIALGTDSNILADQVNPNTPSDPSDIAAGSFGVLDAYLGSKELSEGFYTLRVTNNSIVPQELRQFFGYDLLDPSIRLEPVEGFERIGEDRFEVDGLVVLQDTTANGSPVVFGTVDANGLTDAAVDFGLGDVPLWTVVDSAGGNSELIASNPFRGGDETDVVTFDRVGAIAVNPQTGLIVAYRTESDANQTDGTTGNFIVVDPRTGNATPSDGAEFETVERTINNMGDAVISIANNGGATSGFGVQLEALSFVGGNELYGVGHRGENQQTWTGALLIPDANGAIQVGPAVPNLVAFNFLYELNPTTGAVVQPNGVPAQSTQESGRANPSNNNPVNPAPVDGTNFTPQAWIPSSERVVGLADIGGTLYAVDEGGGFFTIDVSNGNVQPISVAGGAPLGAQQDLGFLTQFGVQAFGYDATSGNKVLDEAGLPIQFTDLTSGLLNLDGTSPEGVPYDEILFGTDTAGNLHAFDVDGNLQHVFSQGRASIPLNVGNVQGIALANLDVNLWHITNTEQVTGGHFGVGSTEDIDGFRTNAANNGGQSLYFGYENPNNLFQNQDDDGYIGSNRPNEFNTYDFASGAQGSLDSQVIDLSNYSAGDRPTLYFDYVIDTDDVNGNRTRDALRVFVSGDDGEWALVATNNDTFNEFVVDNSGFEDDNGDAQFVQHLQEDNDAGWRQARISLSPWAGDEDVRIRIEFNSSGETLPYQAQLYAATVDHINDGDTIELTNTLSLENETLQFDFGPLLNLPTGAAITSGDSFTLTSVSSGPTTFTYSNVASGPTTILVTDTMTPAQVAAATNAAIAGQGFLTVGDATRPQLVNIPDATLTDSTLPTGTLIGNGDFGALLNVPAGVAIPNGREFTVFDPAVGTTTFTYSRVPGGPTTILINDALTPIQVGTATNAALTAQGYVTAFNPARPESVNIPTGVITAQTLPAGTLISNGSSNLVTQIEVTIADSVSDVRDAIRDALALGFNVVGQETNIDVYPTTGDDGILLYDFAIDDVGPLRAFGGVDTGIANPGQGFGANDEDRFLRTGTDNHFGVQIDDVIIGLAERGEIVRNTTAGNTVFVDNLRADNATESQFGTFQLEIRTSAEYGVSEGEDPPLQTFGRESYNSNDIVGDGFGLIATNASSIADGDTFTLSNGIDLVTFEFNDVNSGTGFASGNIQIPFESSFTDVELADALLTAFNSSSVNSALGLSAATVSGQISNATTNQIVFFGPASADQIGGIDFGLPNVLEGVLYGQDVFAGSESGDQNRERDQGQFIIENTIVRDSSQVGIIIDAGRRDRTDRAEGTATQSPRPGAPINFPTPNDTGLAPGAVLRGNIVANNGQSGIVISGDGVLNAGGANAQHSIVPYPAPYVRVVNNTVYNNRIGIDVTAGAAPTLINNIISSNSTRGIQVPNAVAGAGTINPLNFTRANTVVGSTVFHENQDDSNLPDVNDLVLIADGTQVFVDASAENFYPAEFSLAIDSSLTSLPDRPEFVDVKNALGIPTSPVQSPETDLFGQTHRDDSSVNTPAGLGGNVFVDRGAIDRADTLGPQATILNPLDNDTNNQDLDAEITSIQLASGTLSSFDILINEQSGTGPDPATIISERLYLTENGNLLQEGSDYVFGYNASNRTIRLTPLSGIWRPDAVYEITLNNRSRLEFQAPAGQTITDGDQLTITDASGTQRVFEYDAGNAVSVPQTFGLEILSANNGFAQGDTFTISASPTGPSQTFEINLTGGGVGAGNISVDLSTAGTITAVRDAIFDAINDPTVVASLNLAPARIGSDSLQIGSVAGQDLTGAFSLGGATVFGEAEGITDGQIFNYTSGTNTVTFEFDSDSSVVSTGTFVTIAFERTDTNDQLAEKIASAVSGANLGLEQARAVGNGIVVLGGDETDVLQVAPTNLVAGTSASNLEVISDAGVTGTLSLGVSIADGDTSASLDGATFDVTIDGTTETFLLSTALAAGVRGVQLDPTDTENSIAARIAAEIAIAFPSNTSPSSTGNIVTVGEAANLLGSITSASAGLTAAGISGGATAVSFLPSDQFSSTASASGLIRAIQDSALNISAFTPGGGLVLLEDAVSVELTSVGSAPVALGTTVDPVTDIAGNNLLANRVNSETAFTIIMPLVGLDFGDAFSGAVDSFQTTLANNGARHASGIGSLPRLGVILDTELDSQPGTSDDARLPIDADGDVGAVGDAPFTITSNLAGDVFTIVLPTVPSSGQNLEISIDAISDVFEFISGGASVAAGRIPVLFDPNEAIESIVERLADTISETLLASGLPASIEFTPGDNRFSLIAESDEDGVPVGTFDDGTSVQAGLFLANDVRDTTADSGDVVGFLNRQDSNGSVIDVTVTGSGLLDVWIDFNGDGDFDDDTLGEHNVVSFPVVDGVNPIQLLTPSNAIVGSTFARFRLSTGGSISPAGIASSGEVEDYQVNIFDIADAVPNGATYTTIERNSLNPNSTLVADGLSGNAPISAFDTLPAEAFVQPEYIIDAVQTSPNVFDLPNGTLELLDAGTGAFQYTPDIGYFGPETFEYRITTQRNQTVANPVFGTVTINVTPVNDPPTAQNVLFPLLEDDQNFTIDAADLLAASSAGGVNEGNQVLRILSISNIDYANVVNPLTETINGDNQSLTLTTQEGGTLSAEFERVITTTLLGTDADLDTIDDAIDVDITMGTDSDADGIDDALQLWVVSTVGYVPAIDFNSDQEDPTMPGQIDDVLDAFFFELQDDGISLVPPSGTPVQGTPLTGTAIAELDVMPVNDAPIALPEDLFGVVEDDPSFTIMASSLLQNDTNARSTAIDELANINDGALRITDASVNDPSLGQITIDPIGDLVFVPAPEIYGFVDFTYTILDSGINRNLAGVDVSVPNASLSDTVTSRIFVEPVNDRPVAFDRSLVFTERVEVVDPALPLFTITRNDLLNGNAANSLPATNVINGSTITVSGGATLVDGETITFVDTAGNRQFVEFNTTGDQSRPDIRVIQFATTDTAADLASALSMELDSLGIGNFLSGSNVTLVSIQSITTSPDSGVITSTPTSATVQNGLALRNGEQLVITDGNGDDLNIVFNTSGNVGTSDIVVRYALADSEQDIALALQNVLIANGFGATSAVGQPGEAIVSFQSIDSVTENAPATQMISASANTVTLVDPASITVGGESITITDGTNNTVIEFNTTGTPSTPGNVVVIYTLTDTADIIADSLEATIRSLGFGATANGSVVTFSSVTNTATIDASTMISSSGAVITVPGASGLINGETLTVDANNGNVRTVEFNSSGLLTPGFDAVVQFVVGDTAADIATSLASALDGLGIAATAQGNRVAISDSDTSRTTTLETAASPANVAGSTAAPFDESIQTPNLEVVQFRTATDFVDGATIVNGSGTLTTASGGELTVNFVNGVFVDASYEPPVDFNQNAPAPALPVDEFTYVIRDNGVTEFSDGSLLNPALGAELSYEQVGMNPIIEEGSLATVTLTVQPANDPPSFVLPSNVINILEDEDADGNPLNNTEAIRTGVITNVQPGPATADDEASSQTVDPNVVITQLSISPSNLLRQTPTLAIDGTLRVQTTPNLIGTAVYEIQVSDSLGATTTNTITINVQPVNDPPQINPSVLNSSDNNGDPDDAWTVNANGEITYTLREDNTQPDGSTSTAFFIPFQSTADRIGLENVFVGGPNINETNSSPGGSQSISIFSRPITTELGGQLTPRITAGVIDGLLYTPPLNYISIDESGAQVNPSDSFLYTVEDNSEDPNNPGVETFSLLNGILVDDPQRSTNRVFLDLTAVNDRPEATIVVSQIEVPEFDPPVDFDPTDPAQILANQHVLNNFASNVSAGPTTSAFDEIDTTIDPITGGIAGQTTEFITSAIASAGMTSAEIEALFIKLPEIDSEGVLSFLPQADVFGEFVFEVQLRDDGADDADVPAADARGDRRNAIPTTITINVRPTNDPPLLLDNAPELAFELLEDGSVEILVLGDTITRGMLDADIFAPGPPNESQNITPGGNQSISLALPLPASSENGGSLTPIFDATDTLISFIYTPRRDFVGEDSFIYTVIDDGITVDVGTNGAVRVDPRIASNTVRLNVIAVNDEPQFSGATSLSSNEDDGPITITDWATNIQAGPTTASDESVSQTPVLVITQISSNTNLFVTPPQAVVVNGRADLTYETAPDANGEAVFEVFLDDQGPTDVRIGDDSISATQTFTITVNPVNDAPTFDTGQNEVQTLGATGTVTGGTFTLTLDGETTSAIDFDGTANDVQVALENLPGIGQGDVSVTGNALPGGTLRIEFVGALTNQDISDIVVNNAALLGGGSLSTSEIVQGESRLVVRHLESPNPFNEPWATNISPGPVDELGQSVTFTVTVPAEDQGLFRVQPTIDDNGVLRFTTFENAVGVANLVVTPSDSGQLETDPPFDSINLRIEIIEQPDRPVAVADAFAGNEDNVLNIPVADILANDIDPDLLTNPQEALEVQLVSPTSISGVPVSIENGVLVYDPTRVDVTQSLAQGELLTDSVSYFVRDVDGLTSNTVTVSLAITGINDAPQATPDNPVLNPNGPTVITPLANDTDIDGVIDPSSIVITLQPAFGAVAVNDTTGAITYTPFNSFNQVDQFAYTVADDLGERSSETTIEISSNTAPVSGDDAAATFLNESVDIDVAANDFDADGVDGNSIVIIRQPNRGEAIPQGNGIIRYVPELGFVGNDSFQYTIADSLGRTGDAARVDVQVVASRLQNPNNFTDVNADGNVTAIDALLIINRLDRENIFSIPVVESDRGPNFFDTSGDQVITARDALIVINALEDQDVEGEQAVSSFVTTTIAPTVPQVETETGLIEDQPQRIVDASTPDLVDASLVDLIAEDRETEDDEESVDAIDAALSLLI